MPTKTVLTPNNLGSSLETTSEVNKFNAVIQGVSSQAGNVLVNGTDGKPRLTGAIIKANETVTTFIVDNVLKTLTHTNEAGTVTVFPYTALALDVNVTSITDNGNSTYSFLQDDGGPTVVLDLSAMLKVVTTANTTTVALAGTGASGSPLTATVKISSDAGNTITATPTGIFAAATTETTFAATSTNASVTITAAGTAGHTPALVVNTLVVLPVELIEWGTGVHLGQIGT